MKKRGFLSVVMIAALAASAAPVYAEALQGVLLDIDSNDNTLLIAPARAADPQQKVSVSVTDFTKKKQELDRLNSLDVGQTVFMTVEKDPAGTLQLVSLDNPDVPVTTTAKGDQYVASDASIVPGPARALKKLKWQQE